MSTNVYDGWWVDGRGDNWYGYGHRAIRRSHSWNIVSCLGWNCTSITFQVIGKVRNKELIVLIDGGNTYNFIEQFVVTKFGLQVVRDKTIQVTVGNKAIECTGCCMRLSLSIQGFIVRADFYVLIVAVCQTVLRVQWLETLSPIQTDYKELSMTFT